MLDFFCLIVTLIYQKAEIYYNHGPNLRKIDK